MNKLSTVILNATFACFLFSGCNSVSIEGNWVQPIPGAPNKSQGVKLEKDGKASSINMSTLKYESWKLENEELILSGLSIGNGQTISFSDTLSIEKLSNDSLVLRRGNYKQVFSRED